MTQWHVLQHSPTEFYGVRWTYHNSSPRTPRQGLVGLQDARAYRSKQAALDDIARAHDSTGATFAPVPIRFEGRGPHAQITLTSARHEGVTVDGPLPLQVYRPGV